MENASKAIELAIGAILFMVAVTVTILMYGNMINTVNNTLSINNTKTNVVDRQGISTPITYSRAEIYYMFRGITESGDTMYAGLHLPAVASGQLEISYTYTNSGINSLNKHVINNISIH